MTQLYENFVVEENLPQVVGRARLVFLPLGVHGERVAVTVVGNFGDDRKFARPITSRVLKSLPNSLGQACFTFGAILAEDFMRKKPGSDEHLKHATQWELPLTGFELSDWFEVDGYDEEQVIQAALSGSALYQDGSAAHSPEREIAPRSSDEQRFLDDIKVRVCSQAPSLTEGFRRTFSLTNTGAKSELDFVGSSYAACYAAINPKGRGGGLLSKNAAASLWKLARARDAFGMAAPEHFELTAWTPQDGLPIYSSRDYQIVSNTLLELKAQAHREQLTVFSAPSAAIASDRLLGFERPSAKVARDH
jgi:hypothetical protein